MVTDIPDCATVKSTIFHSSIYGEFHNILRVILQKIQYLEDMISSVAILELDQSIQKWISFGEMRKKRLSDRSKASGICRSWYTNEMLLVSCHLSFLITQLMCSNLIFPIEYL